MERKRKRNEDSYDNPNNEPHTKKMSSDSKKIDISELEESIQKSQKNYNNIAKLIRVANGETQMEKRNAPATVALCRVFCRLMVEGKLKKPKGRTEKHAVIVDWLRSRYTDFKDVLRRQLLSSAHETRARALTLTMTLVREEWATSNATLESWSRNGTFVMLVNALLVAPDSEELLQGFVQKYAAPYDDVRHCTFDALLNNMLDEAPTATSKESTNSNILTILSSLAAPDDTQQKLKTFFASPPEKQLTPKLFLSAHKKRAQQTWLGLLRARLTKPQRKHILSILTHRIVLWFPQPETLMDFLTDSFNEGGATSLLSLSGLFYLMQEKNLDYPDFYAKLYALLTPDLLHSKHRSRFFRLLDTFMSSTHLPAAMVASFIKRLSRLALHAPPAGIVAVVPWVYNLLKRHPTCTFMIHRVPRTVEERQWIKGEGADDPFDMDEPDPNKTEAIDSCLWELVTLQSHFHPNVASLAKIISQQFTKQSYNIEDFLDHSYNSLIEAELGKEELKREPVVEFEIPKRMFTLPGEDSTLETTMNQIMVAR